MIYLMYKSAKFGLVLTVTYLQIYIYNITLKNVSVYKDQYCPLKSALETSVRVFSGKIII